MKRSYLYILVFVFAANSIFANTQTAFKLANVLQSNMVVQQGKPFKLWGKAVAGETVVMTVDWNRTAVAVKADAGGNWTGQINVPKAKPGDFTPHVITVKNGDKIVRLTDVLIGDVWLCAGQSNMDMIVTEANFIGYPGVLNYKEEIAAANFPAIRMYKAAAEFKIKPQDDTKGTWTICSPKTVGNFSGVAYFFGRELFLKLNIPIGLVVTSAPGASTQAFTKKEVLTADAALKQRYYDPQIANISSQDSVDKTGFFTNVTKPTLLYNGIIHPLLNLSVKGITYYQGESNSRDGGWDLYVSLFEKMLADWRNDFNQGDLPFYYTQIAPFREPQEDSTAYVAAIFRETQERLLKLKNTGIAVTLDVGERKTVHPSDKRAVGERLAKNALNKTYNVKGVQYLGPRFAKYTVNGNSIKISFAKESLGTGLTTSDGKPPEHFYVAGADKKFYPAKAAIIGNDIVLTGFNVTEPVAVRYAFMNWNDTNLQNKEGLPAMQFRTDNWE
ncbi:sialate O-acetylesterase [Mucilaginibacter hurinus]|uniref:Sialate O-acetylesterase n=1 Tax=Mucilaginibacter hurinus TaxID=2201324 RepID=A0A367GLK3_9SPHI|nr:sialate O-acetylesterase [Mucilaginibacter hurinus]RCH54347.1 sialate O-acetylesterase [Mucilaginibacter hurinus]